MRRVLFFVLLNCAFVMEGLSQRDTTTRFTSISPSATALIRLKANTTIPFAKETAALLDESENGAQQKVDFRKLIHFENRYWSINEMLHKYPSDNILEFSSGYSFRGLDLCVDQNVHVIDTDLPDVINLKKKLQDSLIRKDHLILKGDIKTMPLNVFDLEAFRNIVKLFPQGPVTIVNEGLLPYFNREEKAKLCRIIHQILQERGGYWVTADVYVKDSVKHKDESAQASNFRKEHKLDENRFESYEDAEAFFKSCGLEVVHKESWAFGKLSSLETLSEGRRAAVIHKLQNEKPIRQTWCLQRIATPKIRN